MTSDPERRQARTRRTWPQRLLRALVLLVLALVVLYALFFHIFPWVERQLEDPTLDAAGVSARIG